MQVQPTTVRRTYRYRLYPTKAQATTASHILDLCRELYNGAVQERRDAWRQCGVSIQFAGQSAQLPAIKQVRPDFMAVYSQTLQDVLHRVDKAFQAFFGRCKRPDAKAGYPRFKPRQRYTSFTYPQRGWTLDGDRLALAKIGTIVVEDLNVQGLAGGMLAKSVHDVAWGSWLGMLRYKAESAGTRLLAVDPRRTSQTCPTCGAIAAKPLSERWHRCPCGASMPRDLASAILILARGLASVSTVALEAPGL